ncbi:MAG: hypothetical protein RR791_01690 [Lachnospiraceae bacterium]
MAASFAFHKMVTSGGFLHFESVTSRSLAGTLCLMFFHPSATNTPRGHEEGELISGKVVLRLAQGGYKQFYLDKNKLFVFINNLLIVFIWSDIIKMCF